MPCGCFFLENLFSTQIGYVDGRSKPVLLPRALKANIIQQKTVESDISLQQRAIFWMQ
jgi:hypothetical protein